MKVHPGTERLDDGYDAGHKLEACCNLQIFKDSLHTTETEITEKGPLILDLPGEKNLFRFYQHPGLFFESLSLLWPGYIASGIRNAVSSTG